jgi:negative regulator of sigma F NrsF-like protein
MKDELDLDRLGEIPDPFPDAGRPPQQRNPTQAVRSLTRAGVRGIRIGAVTVALLYDGAWPALIRRRADMASVSPAQLGLQIGAPLVVATMAAWVFGRTSRSGLGERKAILVLVLGSPVLFALATAATLPHLDVDRFWHHTVGCLLVTAILAAGPLAVGMYAYRRAFATLFAWRTAGIGLASGALAAATIALACPISDAWHVLIGHGTAMLLAGALGGLLARRVCRA